MTPLEVIDYALSKPGTDLYYPYGPKPSVIRLGGHTTTHVYSDEHVSAIQEGPIMVIKCQPFNGEFYKQLFPEDVTRGYYCPPSQQPYWITVKLNGSVPDDVQREMLDGAWETVFMKLPKRARDQVLPGWKEILNV